MSAIPLFQVDAFSAEPFKGNPAGVCLLQEIRPDAWMKAVAAEMNLSETAYLHKVEDGFNLRWFTPSVEIDLCGHATLASAHILWQTGAVPPGQTIRFFTRSGVLTATRKGDWIELNFPARNLIHISENETATDALGAVPEECYQSGENLLYIYREEATIREIKPDFASLAQLHYHGIIVTAPANQPRFDFVSRFFAPAIGINEDPVTGSAHCTLGPYWQTRLHKNEMTAYQVSARGGEVKVRVSGERVYISGQAVTIFRPLYKDNQMVDSLVDVVVVGNAGMDTNIYLYGEEIDFRVEANFTQNYDYVGQAGGYASRGYARLGFKTAYIGCVGDDYNGRFVRETLMRDGINLDGLFIDPQGTSRSVNIMYKDGRRKNFYDGKGHMDLAAPVEISEKLFSKARLIHFNIPNWARQLLDKASQFKVPIAVDLQDITDINDPYRQDFINAADYLFFSAANQADPAEIMTGLLQRRPELVIVAGMGSEGCILGNCEIGLRHFPPVFMDRPVIDTNGAGDSLAVGFLSSRVLLGLSLEESILRGQIAARYCCTQKATTDSLITSEQMDQFAQKRGLK